MWCHNWDVQSLLSAYDVISNGFAFWDGCGVIDVAPHILTCLVHFHRLSPNSVQSIHHDLPKQADVGWCNLNAMALFVIRSLCVTTPIIIVNATHHRQVPQKLLTALIIEIPPHGHDFCHSLAQNSSLAECWLKTILLQPSWYDHVGTHECMQLGVNDNWRQINHVW